MGARPRLVYLTLFGITAALHTDRRIRRYSSFLGAHPSYQERTLAPYNDRANGDIIPILGVFTNKQRAGNSSL